MNGLSAHFDNIQFERNALADRLDAIENTPGSTIEELRVVRRQLEQLDHRLNWRHLAPRSWVS